MQMRLFQKLNNALLSICLTHGQSSPVSKVGHFISANAGLGDLGGAESSGFGILIDSLLSILYYYFYILAQFVLKFVDLMEYVVYKLCGIQNDATVLSLGPLAQFMLSDFVLNILGTSFVIGFLLLIIFSIIAIIRSEYEIAIDEQRMGSGKYEHSKYSATHVLKRSVTAIFLMFIVPIILFFIQ